MAALSSASFCSLALPGGSRNSPACSSTIAAVVAGSRKIEERMTMLTEAVEDAVMHFIRRNGAGFTGWHPAIPSTQHAEKPGMTFIHDFAADCRRILLGCHAPAQIDVHQVNSSLQQLLAQSRKYEADRDDPAPPACRGRSTK